MSSEALYDIHELIIFQCKIIRLTTHASSVQFLTTLREEHRLKIYENIWAPKGSEWEMEKAS